MPGKGKGGRGKKGGKSTSSSAKAGLQFPVGRMRRYLRNGRYAARIGAGAPVYMAAVMEYLVAEILELSGNAAKETHNYYNDPQREVIKVDVGSIGCVTPEGAVAPIGDTGRFELSAEMVAKRNSVIDGMRQDAEEKKKRDQEEKEARDEAARQTRSSDASKMLVDELKDETMRLIGALPTNPKKQKLAQVVANLRGGSLHEVTLLRDKAGGEPRYTGLNVSPCDRTEADSNSPVAGGWRIDSFVDHTAAGRSSILGTLVAGDIILQIDGDSVLKNTPTKMASSRVLFDGGGDSMTLMVYSPSQAERKENGELRDRLIQQDAAKRKDKSYANSRHN